MRCQHIIDKKEKLRQCRNEAIHAKEYCGSHLYRHVPLPDMDDMREKGFVTRVDVGWDKKLWKTLVRNNEMFVVYAVKKGKPWAATSMLPHHIVPQTQE